MAAPDDPKGEVELRLGSTTFIMRPTFEAQRRIQREIGEGLVALADRVFDGNYGIEEVFVIAKHGIVAGGTEIDEDELGELIARAGMRNVITPILEFLAIVLGGWGDTEKNLHGRRASQ